MLVVRADAGFAREIFRREGRGLWSQALPLVLEKHGYLGVELAGPEAMRRPDLWRRHGCAVVTRLPDDVWSDAVVERIAASDVPVLIEGPAPAAVRAAATAGPGAPASASSAASAGTSTRLRLE
jgi:hypothetical protein